MIANAKKIQGFVDNREIISQNTIYGNFIEAEKALDFFEKTYGKSNWGIEARIAVLYGRFGRERAQIFAESVFNDDKNDSLVKYLTRHFLVRSASETSVDYLLNDLKAKNDWFDCYLKLRVIHFLPSDPNYFLPCLRREWKFSIFDRYQILTSILMKLISDETMSSHLQEISREVALKIDRVIRDPLIQNLVGQIEGKLHAAGTSPGSYFQTLDSYTLGKYENLVIEGEKRSAEHFWPELIELGVKSQIYLGRAAPARGVTPIEEIEYYIRLIFEKNEVDASGRELIRLSMANSYCPKAKYFFYLVMREMPEAFLDEAIAFNLKCSSHYTNPLNPKKLHFSISQWSLYDQSSLPEEMIESATFKLINTVYGNPDSPLSEIDNYGLPEDRKDIYQGNWHLRRGMGSEANKYFQRRLIPSANSIIFQNAIRGMIEGFLLANDIEGCVCFVSDLFIAHPNYFNIYRIADIISQYEKKRPKGLEKKIELPILSHAYSIGISNQSDTRIGVRIERFLKENLLERPSAVADMADIFGIKNVVYFLKEICIPELMREFVLLPFESLEELQEERIRICSKVIDLDPSLEKEMFEEITTRTRELEMRKGLKDIQRGRINVDVDGVRRALVVALEPVFNRFVNLCVVPEVRFDLKELKIEDPENGSMASISFRSERELIFRAIVMEIRNKFVSSNEYGLDGYLSMKIRHGVLQNQLWKPLENASLVTPKEKSGEHKPNLHWHSRLKLSEVDFSCLDFAMSEFSVGVFEIISVLKDKWLQVRLDDGNKEALFDFRISNSDFEEIEQVISADEPLEDFIDVVVAKLWEKTEAGLEKARIAVTNEILVRFDSVFDGLLLQLNEISDSKKISELVTLINEMRTIVSHEIGRIAGWFVKPMESNIEKFKVDRALSVSIAGLNNVPTARAFMPEIQNRADVELRGYCFRPFVDVFNTLLYNALSYSNVPNRFPKVSVVMELENGALKIFVRNEIAPGSVSAESREKLDRIKAAISSARGNFKLTQQIRKEGGTGFFKIMKVFKIDMKTNAEISVGYDDAEEVFEFLATIDLEALIV